MADNEESSWTPLEGFLEGQKDVAEQCQGPKKIKPFEDFLRQRAYSFVDITCQGVALVQYAIIYAEKSWKTSSKLKLPKCSMVIFTKQ